MKRGVAGFVWELLFFFFFSKGLSYNNLGCFLVLV